MDFSVISTVWAALGKQDKLLIVAELGRMPIAEQIKAENSPYVSEANIIDISLGNSYIHAMQALDENDLLVVLLTMEGFMTRGYRDVFSPFSKPRSVAAKYIFMRLDIPKEPLLAGLNTDFAKVEATVREYRAFESGKTMRVTTEAGTDITVQVAYQELIPYSARALGGHAFLPPAEISEELVPGSANGVIVADITVGELRFGPELIDPLGLVDIPVKITVENGLVTDITGGETAQCLKAGLDRLDKSLQAVVELGHGLSDMAPTGIIGVDESMVGTCHFGIGNRNPYHVDVVVARPKIEVVGEAKT